ncbi:UNVERIFIED_CONTAM: hypothetical protein FKN15_020845 [Acipenser sinensis]
METNENASVAVRPRPLSCDMQYPEEIKSAQAKKQHKLKVMRDHPECLYADYALTGEQRVKTNLIFYTEQPTAWHTALCNMYSNIKKRGICNGRQISVGEDSDPDSTVFTVNVYHNGTVLIQGSEASLNSFEECFTILKEQAEMEKSFPENKFNTVIIETIPPVPPPERENAAPPHTQTAALKPH